MGWDVSGVREGHLRRVASVARQGALGWRASNATSEQRDLRKLHVSTLSRCAPRAVLKLGGRADMLSGVAADHGGAVAHEAAGRRVRQQADAAGGVIKPVGRRQHEIQSTAWCTP
jgi:hypothetical protein